MQGYNWLDDLERKIGKAAIPNLMRYVIFGSAIVYVISLIAPNAVYFLNMDPAQVLKGQVWRLITFVFVPSLGNPLMTALSLFCYYWIGGALERSWGTFKFNFYFFVGVIAIDIVLFISYFLGYSLTYMYHQAGYLFQSMFLALATMFPDFRVLLMLIIPIKSSWMGYISAALLIYEFIIGSLPIKLLILASMAGYLIFFGPVLYQRVKRLLKKDQFQRTMNSSQQTRNPFEPGRSSRTDYGAAGRSAFNGGTGGFSFGPKKETASPAGQSGQNVTRVAFHRCTICGITELDDPNMTFRYCSQCNGNYEYCENHIRNHQHIQ
ncbi:MAG: hypothetical protein J5589_04915 [Firmicutes bacterium]|nr:hypothetical protein [Bacillota bacterium]